jgi:hypothetical protein
VALSLKRPYCRCVDTRISAHPAIRKQCRLYYHSDRDNRGYLGKSICPRYYCAVYSVSRSGTPNSNLPFSLLPSPDTSPHQSHRGDDATRHSWSRGLPPALRRRHWSASFYTCTRQTATTGPTWGTRMQEALTNQTLAEDQHQQSGGEVTHTQSGRWWWEIWHLGTVDDSRDRPPHYHPEPCSCSNKSDP